MALLLKIPLVAHVWLPSANAEHLAAGTGARIELRTGVVSWSVRAGQAGHARVFVEIVTARDLRW